jgi:hypothetical protein
MARAATGQVVEDTRRRSPTFGLRASRVGVARLSTVAGVTA